MALALHNYSLFRTSFLATTPSLLTLFHPPLLLLRAKVSAFVLHLPGTPSPTSPGVCPPAQTPLWYSKAIPEGPVYFTAAASSQQHLLFPSRSYSFSIYTPFSHAGHLIQNEPHESSDCVGFIFCCFPKIQPGSSTGRHPTNVC